MRVHSLHDKHANIVLDDAVYRGGARTLEDTSKRDRVERSTYYRKYAGIRVSRVGSILRVAGKGKVEYHFHQVQRPIVL
jgi:hypothetical protein